MCNVPFLRILIVVRQQETMNVSKYRYEAGFFDHCFRKETVQPILIKIIWILTVCNPRNYYFCTYFLTNHKRFFDMKKTVLGILAGAVLTLSMASCGEKLLTPEQVQAEITAGFDAGKATVDTEVNAKCEAEFETRVTEKVNMLDQAAQAAEAAPALSK